jgi:hypothetical protein
VINIYRYYLNRFWDENKVSLIKYIQEVHRGLVGLVIDTRGNPVPDAAIVVLNPDGERRGKNVLSSLRGEYWRLLLPATYRFKNNNTGVSLCCIVWHDK